jgi:phosphatidylserine/phosphatidylglycerophosphate/cardiolipin synthase-like enzyme
MKNNYAFFAKTLLAFLLLSHLPSSIYGQEIDLTKKLINRELLYTRYQEVLQDLTDLKRKQALTMWTAAMLSDKKTGRYQLQGIAGGINDDGEQLKGAIDFNIIPHQYWRNLLAHYFLVGNKNQFALGVELYLHLMTVLVEEWSQDPLIEKSLREEAKSLYTNINSEEIKNVGSCVKNFSTKYDIQDGLTNCIQKLNTFNQIKKLIHQQYIEGQTNVSIFVKSPVGFIPGNKVQLLTLNTDSESAITQTGELNKLFQMEVNTNYANYTELEFAKKMEPLHPLTITKDFFKTLPLKHPVFYLQDQKPEDIFSQVWNKIEKAKSSVFIDVFFLGGAMGVSLSKLLIKKANEGIKVFVLNDQENPLGYKKELVPVFNFLRGYSYHHPNMIVLSPNIFLKRTSLPDFFDLLVDDQLLKELTMQENPLATLSSMAGSFPKAKSDHSKVFVIDGNSDDGTAFVGSKNFTDSSGAVAYDEMAMVQGPAVKVILDSYYWDLDAALRIPTYSHQFNNIDYIDQMIKLNNSENSEVEKNKLNNLTLKIRNILSPLDILNRNLSAPKKILAKKVGSDLLGVGENNVNGVIRSCLEQNIQTILSAKKQILIKDQFLYDKKIIIALNEARKKGVKIFVTLASLTDPRVEPGTVKEFAHIPNSIYINDLTYGENPAQIKWKTITRITRSALMDAAEKNNEGFSAVLSPEFHLKGLSIDGVLENEMHYVCQQGQSITKDRTPVLISGSANKDNMTMLGGFREFQLQIFNHEASKAHDCLFWETWNNQELSTEATPEVLLPKKLAEKITGEQFLSSLKNLMINSYNFFQSFITN